MSDLHATLVTPTYAADFDHARTLCASLDRFMAIPHRHLLVVPSNDVALFRALAGPRREVIAKEAVLGCHGFHRLPVPRRIRVPGLIDRRIKEQWWRRGAGRLSGWLIQQIVKLSAPELTQDEHLVFIDSDVALVRPFAWQHLARDGMVRLHEHHRGIHHATHHSWRDAALALTGGTPEAGEPTNYIGHLIGWRRSNLVALQARIEVVMGMDWRLAIAQRRDVSEYILYGYFVRGLADSVGHVREDLGLVRSLWADDAASLETFAQAPDEGHVAIHIQSTLPMPRAERERWVARLSSAIDGGKA